MPRTPLIAATTVALGACTTGVPSHPDIYVAPRCEARLVGQVAARSAAVDATDAAIYWLGFDDGTLQRRSRGEGEIETMLGAPDAQATESMRVAGAYVYWTSNLPPAVHRLALGGGTPEVILEADADLTELELVGDVVYAGTSDGRLLWWRDAGEHGVIEVSDTDVWLAAGADALYVGSDHAVRRLASPGAGLQDVVAADGLIEAVAAWGDRVYWKEADQVMRRIRGQVERVTTSSGFAVLAAAADGLLLGESNVVSFAADDRHDVVPVAITPAELTDLEVRGPSVFAGTDAGSVHELCVDPAAPVGLDPPAPCDGEDCAWYASGALAARTRVGDDGVAHAETYYADGTLRAVDPDAGGPRYFLDGTAAAP